MKRGILPIVCLLAFVTLLPAQEWKYGFKAGLNFSTFLGPLEEDAAGMALEEFDYTTGFHVGAVVGYAFSDYVGIRGELLYSQKGSRYRFEGPSYQLLEAESGNIITTFGDKRVSLNITNSHIDLPVMGFVRVFDWLEISAGANVGFLANATAAGELIYSGETAGGTKVNEFSITLEYNFYADEPGEAEFIVPNQFNIGSETIVLPNKAGAYFDREKLDEPYFERLDFGLIGGLSFYLSEGFYLGGRLNYGLLDVTNNAYDRSLAELDENNQFIPREDKDGNLSVQVSAGFNF